MQVFCDIEEHKSVNFLLTSEPLRTQCISFVFDGNAPLNTPKLIYAGARNFTPDCFLNEGQFNACFVKMLRKRKNIQKSNGLRSDHSATPNLTEPILDLCPPTETNCLRSER